MARSGRPHIIGMFSTRGPTAALIRLFLKHGFTVRVAIDRQNEHHFAPMNEPRLTFYPCEDLRDAAGALDQLTGTGFFEDLDRLFNPFDSLSELYFRAMQRFAHLRDDYYYNWGNCSVKHHTRQILQSRGVDATRFLVLEPDDVPALSLNGQALLLAGRPTGMTLPVVIKPAVGTASFGVHIVKTHEDFARCITRLEIDSAHADEYPFDRLLCEEFIDGVEFECDGYMASGELNLIMYGVKIFDSSVFPREIGSILCAHGRWEQVFPFLPEPADWAASVISALAFRQGVFHIEGKIAEGTGDFHLIEFNPRSGGGTVSQSAQRLSGVNLHHKTAELFADIHDAENSLHDLGADIILTVPVYSGVTGAVAHVEPEHDLTYADDGFHLKGIWLPLFSPKDVIHSTEGELYIGEIQLFLTRQDMKRLRSSEAIRDFVEEVVAWTATLSFFTVE